MTTVARVRGWMLVLLLIAIMPAAAYGQASITGVVRASSGPVLAGVTVEAESPALIEKTRSVVSDDSGQYRIVDLQPGIYTVKFTLGGFNTFVREGIELAGNFTATINADLVIGAVQETIVVTAEAPLVDVQGVTRQRVMTDEIVQAVPTGKYFVNLGILIPGVSASCSAACQTGTSQDTGGASGDNSSTLIAHGSRFRDQRIAINGMTVRGSTGYLGVTGPNIEAQQETQIDTSGADASVGTGGVRVNVVPKDGGNEFGGGLFFSGANEHFQGSNIDQELRDRGLTGTTEVKHLYDFAPTFGGPLKQDKLWFFLSYRRANNLNYAANLFKNVNAGVPDAWTYVPDTSQRATFGNPLPMAGVRLTWQATARNKIAASFDYRDRCQCPNLGNGGNFGISPEAAVDFMFQPQNIGMVTWSSPVTNRLLLEATFVRLFEGWGNKPAADAAAPGTIRVIEQNPPDSYLGVTTYRGSTGGNWTDYPYTNTGFNATYVTGAHAFKAGVEFDWGYNDRLTTADRNGPITSIRVNSATGVPVANQFTVNLDPVRRIDRARADGGVFIQDRWTSRRVTLSGGLRLDFFDRYAEEVTEGPTPLQPTRNITFPTQQVVRYRDLSPRIGMAYDVFGNSKTAFKLSLNRYVQDLSLLANNQGSAAQNYQSTAARSWTDSNKNFYPDCDFVNPALQNLTATGGDICGAFTGANANFGLSVPTSVDDRDVDGFGGFNHRGSNWEFSTGVQQEIVARRVAVDVAYFRRWYGNFTVTDNFVASPADYSEFKVVVPTDERLPLSGQTLTFLDLNPDKASLPSDNHVRFSKNYGEQYERWHGLDVSASARIDPGVLVQGGISTGKQVTDNCAVLSKVPEGATNGVSLTGATANIAGPLAVPFCHQEQPWLMQVKGLATYTIPHIDVQLSGAFQSIPGPQIGGHLGRDERSGDPVARPTSFGRRQRHREYRGAGQRVRRPAESDRLAGWQDLSVRRGAPPDDERRPLQSLQRKRGSAAEQHVLDDQLGLRNAAARAAGSAPEVHSRVEFLIG